jgi:hypothetical protein
MQLDPLKTYADVRPKDRVVVALVTGISVIPDWAMRGRKIVEVPGGVSVAVGMVFVNGIFRSKAIAVAPDYSDIEKISRADMAIGLVIAELSNTSLAQLKVLFKTKYDSLG